LKNIFFTYITQIKIEKIIQLGQPANDPFGAISDLTDVYLVLLSVLLECSRVFM